MGGSKLQLYSKGIENNYLTKNPEMTYFKSVFKRYSNFAMQSIDLHFEKNAFPDYDVHSTIKLKLGKNGDLIHKLFLELNLPNIYHDIRKTDQKKIMWAKNIGEIIIKEARIYIGGELIESLDSDYLHIYNSMYETHEQNKMRKNMIDVDTSLTKYSSKKEYIDGSKSYIDSYYNNIPTLESTRIIIPLPFWFHRDIGCSLPIQNLIYHDALIEIDIRPIKELMNYIKVSDIDVGGTGVNNEIIIHKQIKSCTTDFNITIKDVNNVFENGRWDIDPILNTTFIFLDKDEKKRFIGDTLQYLVEPIQKYEIKSQKNSIILKEELSSEIPRHMCKEIIIYARRDDMKNSNNWLNFTNLDDISNNYYDYQNYFYKIAFEGGTAQTNKIINLSQFIITNNTELTANNWLELETDLYINADDTLAIQDVQNFVDIWNYRDYNSIPYIGRDNQDFFTENILKNITINFDETVRVNKHDTDYYNKIQPYIHHNNNVKGVYSYSFSLNPDTYQPSGKSNFEHLKNISIEIDLKNPDDHTTENYLYDILVYFKYYNVLEIKSGMGDLLFRN